MSSRPAITFIVIASLAVLFVVAPACNNGGKRLLTFQRTQLSDVFFAEGSTFGDVNGDGINDVVAGPYWYEGPDFDSAYAYYEPKPFDPSGYSDNFFAFVYDFNADDRNDILIVGYPGKQATWYENPDSTADSWEAHVVLDAVDNESPAWTDLTGDNVPELVFISNGRYGYAGPDPVDPAAPWTFHAITPDSNLTAYTHGLGVGDVNGDGRMDLLEHSGWWEQPRELVDDSSWLKHEFLFSQDGGAQMYTYDFDGDGDADIATSLEAHGYGLVWYEQVFRSGQISFIMHIIINETADENDYGVSFAELHALDLADIDGDGIKDIVTGKRWWSHGDDGDPDPDPKAWLYWFKTVRHTSATRTKTASFVPHLIDDDTGVGVQVVAGDINGDRMNDVVVSNKKGTFVLLQERRLVDKSTWTAAQPKRVYPR